MRKQFASLPVDCGDGYLVEFRFTPAGIICEWVPGVPNAETPPRVLARYTEAMAAFIWARCHRQLGDVGPVTTELR